MVNINQNKSNYANYQKLNCHSLFSITYSNHDFNFNRLVMKKILLLILLSTALSCGIKPQKNTLDLPPRVDRLFEHLDYQPKTNKEAFFMLYDFMQTESYVVNLQIPHYPEWLKIYLGHRIKDLESKHLTKAFNAKLQYDFKYLRQRYYNHQKPYYNKIVKNYNYKN